MTILGTITHREAKERILATKGSFFSVDFTKRETGEIRRMNCRMGVKKHLAGGPAAYVFSDHNLIPVWDTEKQAYRSIPLENIIKISIGGDEFYVKD